MKKILIITNKFPFGKDETFLETELKFLLKSKLNVRIFSQNTDVSQRKIDPSISIHTPQKKGVGFLSFLRYSPVLFGEFFRNFGSVFKLKVLYRAYTHSVSLLADLEAAINEFDKEQKVLVYSYWHDNSTLTATLLKRKYKNLELVTRVHGGDLYSERSKGNYLPFRKAVYNTVQGVFCISKNGQDYLKGKYPSVSHKFHTAFLGTINTREFEVLSANPQSFISCSHINPVKRLDLLIHSISSLSRECRWEHFGYGFDYNEKTIFELVDEVLPQSKVNYKFHGQIPNDQVTNSMSEGNFSFLINLSESEGLPVTMMEAMSCGIPCIGTNVGGVSEIIEDGVNGFLLSANPSLEEIHDVMNKCLDMESERLNSMRLNAFKTWGTKFKAEQNYSMFAQSLLEF